MCREEDQLFRKDKVYHRVGGVVLGWLGGLWKHIKMGVSMIIQIFF